MHIPSPSKSRGTSGLSVLLGGSNAKARLVDIPLASIVRNDSQPRTHFDPAAIAALAESISANGIIQPIAVREEGGRYQIVAGERRWLACQRAGLKTVPALIHDVDERGSLVLALAENLVREGLNPLETARAYASLIDEFDMSVAELARAVGKSRPAVANTLRLLELPDEVLAVIQEGRLSEGHGRALLQVADRAEQRRLASSAIERALSVRALEALCRQASELQQIPANQQHRGWDPEASAELQARANQLGDQLGCVRAKVKIGERGAKLELHCADPARMLELLDRLQISITERR